MKEIVYQSWGISRQSKIYVKAVCWRYMGTLTFATVGETIPWPGLPSIFPGRDIEVLVRVDVPRTVKGENVSGVVDVL